MLFLISLNHCLWSGKQILLNSCWRSANLMLLNSRWQFGDILLLSRNDRICSFNWIRGSKHCFPTSFSNLYCYFLFLVFSRRHNLLVSLHLSWLRGTLISHPINTFRTLNTTSYMHPHISGTHYAFSWSKTLVGTWYQNKYRHSFPVPPFFLKVSRANIHWTIANYTFSFQLNPQTDTFSHDMSLC